MNTQLWRVLGVFALGLSVFAGPASGQGGKNDPKEEAALLKNAEAFVAAFHQGDAKAVAAFWAVDGDYTDQTGKHLKGREAIEKAFAGFFAENKGAKLRIDIESLRFVTPEVAVEDGVTQVIPADGTPPSRARYTIVHAKKDGKWVVQSVRDAAFAAPTNYEHLRQLEWAVGNWAADPAQGEVARVSFSWAENQNFLLTSITTTNKNISLGGATQWVGWDPVGKQLRSWTFESNGGFGEGTWSRAGDQWTVKTKATLRDGKQVTATNVITRIDADTFSWQARDITVDGKKLDDGKEVKMKRVK